MERGLREGRRCSVVGFAGFRRKWRWLSGRGALCALGARRRSSSGRSPAVAAASRRYDYVLARVPCCSCGSVLDRTGRVGSRTIFCFGNFKCEE